MHDAENWLKKQQGVYGFASRYGPNNKSLPVKNGDDDVVLDEYFGVRDLQLRLPSH